MGRYKERKKKSQQSINDSLKGQKHRELDSIKTLIENGSTAKGQSELLHYLEKYPNDAYGHYYLGKIFMKNSDFQSAKREFEQVIAAHEKNYYSGLIAMARACRLSGDIESARTYYEEAIENNKYNYLISYLSLASLEYDDGNYYRALNILNSALELPVSAESKESSGTKNDVKILIAKNLMALGRDDEAEAILESIIPENREQARKIALRMGIIYRTKSSYQESLQWFEKARLTDKKDNTYYQATFELARVHKELGNDDEQIACLEELYNSDVTLEEQLTGELYFLLGTARLKKQDYSGAKLIFKNALSGSDFEIRNICAYYYSSLQYLEGDTVGAETTLKQTLKKNHAISHVNYMTLIRILYDQGHLEEAHQYLEEAKSKNDDDDEAFAFRRLEILINRRLGLPKPNIEKCLYLEHQFLKYRKQDAIAHIENSHLGNFSDKSAFPQGTNISELIDDVLPFLIEDNKLMVNVVDEYQIPYPNAGYRGDKICDYIRIKTIPGTTQIVTIHPAEKSLLPTLGEVKTTKSKQLIKENDRIKRFNARFEKFETKK